MTLEATYICIDNSEHMRNGDYSPTRLQAVCQACNVLCGAKTQANPENGVGFLTMGNDSIKIIETLTPDLGRLLSSITSLRAGGKLDLVKGLQVGHLGLKHRNSTQKNQRQRIVAFVGSPVTSTEKELVTLAKKLKKHSVCVDVVSFGCEANNELLKKFVDTVNSKQQDKDTSNLLVVPEGQSISDALLNSPILGGDGSGAMAIDANHDPELAMVLRMSLEEERARQEKARNDGGAEDTPMADGGGGGGGGAAPGPADGAEGGGGSIEDEQIARALQLSMQEAGGGEEVKQEAPAPAQPAEEMQVDAYVTLCFFFFALKIKTKPNYREEGELTEEQMIEMALKMSMEEAADPEVCTKKFTTLFF